MWWAVVKTVGEEGGSREALVPFFALANEMTYFLPPC